MRWTIDEQKKFLQEIANQKGCDINIPESLYALKKSDFGEQGKSMINAIKSLKKRQHIPVDENWGFDQWLREITGYDFKPWLFHKKPAKCWNEQSNARGFCDWLFNKLGWTTWEQRFQVTRNHIIKNGGNGLLDRFSNRTDRGITIGKGVIELLQYAYLEEKDNILPWLFKVTSQGCWNDFENHKLFAKWVEEKEGIQSPDGWYRITGHYVSKTYDPSILVNKYNSSLQQFLVTVYPEFPWKMYRFIQTPHDYWNEENVKEFIKDFQEEFNALDDPTKLYTLSKREITDFGGANLLDGRRLNNVGGYSNLIMRNAVVPDGFVWDVSKFYGWKTEEKVLKYLVQKQLIDENQKTPNGYNTFEWITKRNENGRGGVCRFDFSCVSKILGELDGNCHFKEFCKTNSFHKTEGVLERDVWKMKKSVENGYSGFRLYQPDVWDDKNDWKDWILRTIEFIKQQTNPVWVFPKSSETTYEEHINQCKLSGVVVHILE
jgi:hypothetical protein